MPRKSTSPSAFRRFVRRFLRIGGALVLLAALAVGAANAYLLTTHSARLYTDPGTVPACEVGLVLGTSPYFQDGRANLHFEGRMDAAAALFRAGKVKHLLVSGDNRQKNYNEPKEMRAALVKRGIPESAITLDYAGFRTLDSVVRARKVFQLDRVIIITQRYHNPRALEIARASGLDAWGYCAADVVLAHSIKTECREVLARTLTILDLYVLHRQPYFLGDPEPIRVEQR